MAVTFLALQPAVAADAVPQPVPLTINDLIAFWDFQEPAGTPRVSHGPVQLDLQEHPHPIQQVRGGVFGPFATRLKRGEWLMIERDKIGPLDRHGPQAQVTVVAWIKRQAPHDWQAIAGVWDETRSRRQYCLFLNAPKGTNSAEMKRYPLKNRIHGHVSDVGGPSSGERFCITYSTGATEIPLQKWTCIAMTYDGQFSRVYVNGQLDSLEAYNPFPLPGGLFDGGSDGAPFTVGAVHRSNEWGNCFGGDIGGLAVYSRALNEDELKQLAAVVSSKP